ncbi:hypothetical protein V8C42DRAFT_363290 [Trichoderma barbatum]
MAPSRRRNTARYACDQCSVVYNKSRHLERHRKIHEKLRLRAIAGQIRYNCSHCPGVFATDDILQRHINAYHFKQTDERHACRRCLRYKLPCTGTSPCKWCKIDGEAAECVIVIPQTTAAPIFGLPIAVPAYYEYAATSPQQQMHIKREWSPDGMSIKQEEPDHARHASAGWSTPRPNSPTDSILSLPPRRLPPMDVDSSAGSPGSRITAPRDVDNIADSHAPRIAAPGEVDIRAGSLSWVDFEVTYLRDQAAHSGEPYAYYSLEPADTGPLDGSLVMALDSLGLLFKAPYIPQLLELSELTLVPGIELLRQLVDNYFLKWQKVQPIAHVATWKFAKTPMVLLGAMACIGALFDQDSEIIHQAHLISSRCVSELNIMAVRYPENGPNIAYLAAVCLHQTYLLGSGDENIHTHVNGVRKFLINSLHSLGLLGADISGQDRSAQVPEVPTRSEQSEWTEWVARELEIRTTWAVFEYDCSYSLLTNRPCAIDLRDLPPRLPCCDDLYEAPDAHSWAELRRQSPLRTQGPLVSTVVAASAAGQALSDDVSPWSKRLCTQILERIFRGFMRQSQRDSTILAARQHELDLDSITKERTESLLWSITFLGMSISDAAVAKPLSTMDLINFSSTKLIRHYTHLTLHCDFMDLITYIARVASSPKLPNSRTTLRWAQQKLIEQFAMDPYKSRQYVWHAAQMVRVAKIYAIFAPCDNLRIFTAYITILAFAKYGPHSLRDVDSVEPFPIEQCPHCDNDVEDWLQNGGPVRIGACARIQAGCPTEQIIRESFQMLYRLENWGISERFFNILVHFNDLNVLDK